MFLIYIQGFSCYIVTFWLRNKTFVIDYDYYCTFTNFVFLLYYLHYMVECLLVVNTYIYISVMHLICFCLCFSLY